MLLEVVKYIREVKEVVREDGGRGVWLPPLPPLPLLVLPLQSASLAKFSMLCSSMVPRPPAPSRVPTVPPGSKIAIERLKKGGVGVGEGDGGRGVPPTVTPTTSPYVDAVTEAGMRDDGRGEKEEEAANKTGESPLGLGEGVTEKREVPVPTIVAAAATAAADEWEREIDAEAPPFWRTTVVNVARKERGEGAGETDTTLLRLRVGAMELVFTVGVNGGEAEPPGAVGDTVPGSESLGLVEADMEGVSEGPLPSGESVDAIVWLLTVGVLMGDGVAE